MSKYLIRAGNFQDVVEQQIREAQRNGSFDNLPFKGEPLPEVHQVFDENWWIKKKLRDEGLSHAPEPIRIRRKTEQWLKTYLKIPTEMMVRQQATRLNVEIAKTNKGPLGPMQPQSLLNIDKLIATWRQKHSL